MEHEHVAQRQDPRGGPARGTQASFVPQAYLDDVQRRLEEISNDRCVIRHYTDVTQAWLDAADARSLILGGNLTTWDRYDQAKLQPLFEIIRRASLPILGLCGGLQVIALAHGVNVGPIQELESGEEDLDPSVHSGCFREWGFTPVHVVTPDPLFDGLEAPVFLEAHYWEAKSIPPGFDLLASTDASRIQALRQTGTLVYGTQFHPEAYIVGSSDCHSWLIDLVYPNGYTQTQPDGRRLLANFFREAGIV